MRRILVIEDESDLRSLISIHLVREGWEVKAFETAEEGEAVFRNEKFDLLVLDWMLPGMNGLEFCKRNRGVAPILMVTARADSSDIVAGLEMGADDYLTKPFEIPVLIARCRALLRRTEKWDGNPPQRKPTLVPGAIQIGELIFDEVRYQVKCAGEEVQLTPSEFKLLGALVKNAGRVLTRDRLIDLVQGQGVTVIDRAVDTHVFGLRKKLGKCADLIETIRGVGYRIQSES